MEWRIILSGNPAEIEDLSQALTDADVTIRREGEEYVLMAASLQSLQSADAVKAEAERLIAHLDGAAHLALDVQTPIQLLRVACVKDDGTSCQFVWVTDSIRAMERFGLATVCHDGQIEQHTPNQLMAGWLGLADDNENVAKALRLLGNRNMNWVDLYRLIEVVEHDVGGRDEIKKRGWATTDDLGRFRHTANSVAASGDNARHGKEETQPPVRPMSLDEGRAFVEPVVRAWLQFRAQAT